jgi:predicted unusual protein kinase regulating ubiquinone biosynthesis (AarF/ABC1/UbiB family)
MSNVFKEYAKPFKIGLESSKRFIFNYQNKKQNATWLKNKLIKSGPAYVKVGQIISNRDDIFPSYIIHELGSLQNKLPPISFDYIEKSISHELNVSNIYNIFEYIEPQPISTASIGQVHFATLKNHKDVVIKVKRNNVDLLFENDFNILLNIFKMFHMIIPNNRQFTDIYDMLNEYSKHISDELDLTNEMNNIKIMKNIYKHDDTIIIPDAIDSLCSRNMLVLEHVTGKHIRKLEHNQSYYASQLMYKNIQSILDYGIIHGDLHAGNLSIIEESRQIVLYDFGIIVKVDSSFFKEFITQFIINDIQQCIKILEINEIIMVTDSRGYKQLEHLFKHVFEYIQHYDVQLFIKNVIEDKNIGTDLYFQMNPSLFMLSRAFTVLEGTCRILNPNFNYQSIGVYMIDDILDVSMIFEKALKDINKFMN